MDEAEGIPGGRLPDGEALVMPHLFPYERYSAVTILAKADFVPLGESSKNLLSEAFRADLDYLERVREMEVEGLRHYSANGNYMPLSEGPSAPPHHQLIASPVPSNYHREVEAGLSRYKGDYCGDLARLVERGERPRDREGSISWLTTAFAPIGHVDAAGVFVRRSSIFGLTAEDVRTLSRSLLRIFAYPEAEGFASFNYGLEGAHGFGVRYRLSPRFLLSNTLGASDMNYLDVSRAGSLAFFYPEEAAKSLRERFEDLQRGGSR
jgi:UDPglucose--hexose-1-phosphate uridylyltransferase